MLHKDTKSKIYCTRYHHSLRKKTIVKIIIIISLSIQVRKGFNKCTKSNTVTNAVINAFSVIV